MLQFEDPAWLYALIGVAVLAVLVVLRWGQLSRKRAVLADDERLLALTQNADFGQRKLQWLLGLGALALWVIALANPQFGTRERVAELRNTELVIALDISQSMLAEDVRPSRLTRAQNFVLDILSGLNGEQVGLVLFAGQAYLQMPMTTDYGAAALFVRSVGPEQASTQGTNFASAISLGRQMLQTEEGEEQRSRRLMLLISDGENHEELAEELADEAASDGIAIFTAGIGTSEGAPIPSVSGQVGNYKRDAGGEVVLSQFDAESLEAIAEAAGGRYYDLNGNATGAAGSIVRFLVDGSTRVSGEEVFKESASYFQLFIGLGLVLLGLAFWVGRGRD